MLEYRRIFADVALNPKAATLLSAEGDRFNEALATAVRPYADGARVRLAATPLRASGSRMKPTLFVGSSSESLEVAYAAQRNLEDVAEVVVWTQGIFELTKSYLESLVEALEDTEFGLFIFGADDVIRIRGREMAAARDNVVFELGLFIGRLGRDRTFILMPKTAADFHLPTDLLGISTATFQPPSRPDRLQAALGPACHDIRLAIRKHTVLRNPATSSPPDLTFLLPALIPEPEQKHLFNLADVKTKGYKGGGSVRSELRHLRSIGLIRKHVGRNIGELKSGSVYDLADIVELTDLGRQWAAKLRDTRRSGD